jgi:hypothetical protein
VTVRDGTFAGMQGRVVEVLEHPQRVRVALTLFGRSVPVELEDWQVERVLETEEEWLACTNPTDLAHYLVSPRKQRLFACACVRGVPAVLQDRICREVLEVSERYADGEAGVHELQLSESRLARVERKGRLTPAVVEAVRTCCAAVMPALLAALRACGACEKEVLRQCHLLRDIRGNPFRPVTVHPRWLRWNDGTAPKMAKAIYEGRNFADLPILADALEDAGCQDQTILEHCRGRDEHVRGCWVVDALTTKE